MSHGEAATGGGGGSASGGAAPPRNRQPGRRDAAWERMFQGLAAFRAEHGHCAVPRTHRHEGRCLYDWIRKQREGYRNSRRRPTPLWPSLAPDRAARLAALGLDLTIHGRFTTTTTTMNGVGGGKGSDAPASVVPAAAATFEELPPAPATATAAAPEGPRSPGAQLLRPAPHRSKSYSKQWDAMFQCLAEFRDRNGHLAVPKGYRCHPNLGGGVAGANNGGPGGPGRNLAVWVQAQRQYYRTYARVADPALRPTPWRARIDRLRALGLDLPELAVAPPGAGATAAAFDGGGEDDGGGDDDEELAEDLAMAMADDELEPPSLTSAAGTAEVVPAAACAGTLVADSDTEPPTSKRPRIAADAEATETSDGGAATVDALALLAGAATDH